MTAQRLDLVFLGLSLSSSWGNGHATTYRALLRGLAARGHRLLFLERDVPWYAAARDLAQPEFCRLEFYHGVADLEARFGTCIAAADAVVVGSYVPDGIAVIDRVLGHAPPLCAFYDIDTPVTVASLLDDRCAYLAARQIPALDLYLSFTGGPMLQCLEQRFGARLACPLYCSVDAARYQKQATPVRWDLGYLGTYAEDRQPALQRLLIEPARLLPERRFVVAGSQYPASIEWPANVERIEHVPPADHAAFYCQQRFTLNVTRADMVRCGWSPSVRLFEAASCGTPIISDRWDGLDALLPEGEAVIVADGCKDVVAALHDADAAKRDRISGNARRIVLTRHTGEARAGELERWIEAARERTVRGARGVSGLAAAKNTTASDALRARIEALGPWFHNLRLAGVETAPGHFLGDYPSCKWQCFADAVPHDLSGWTVLDIGCNGGFYSLEMKRRGADRVVAIDSDPRYLRQAALAAEVTGLAVELHQMSVYSIARLSCRFDLVLFMGVLYHLRHPLLALDLIRAHVARDLLVCQSLQRGSLDGATVAEDYPFDDTRIFDAPGAPRMQFIEHRFAGDPTNWWIPNAPCTQAMLRSAGFRIEGRRGSDIYVCRCATRDPYGEPPPDICSGPAPSG